MPVLEKPDATNPGFFDAIGLSDHNAKLLNGFGIGKSMPLQSLVVVPFLPQ